MPAGIMNVTTLAKYQVAGESGLRVVILGGRIVPGASIALRFSALVRAPATRSTHGAKDLQSKFLRGCNFPPV